MLGSGPSPFEATRQRSSGPPKAADLRPNPLTGKRSGPEGRLMLTFVTTTYDALCGNFVLHLRRIRLTNYLLVTFDASQQEPLP